MRLNRKIVDGVPVIAPAEPVEIDIGNREQFKEAFKQRIEPDDTDVVLDASAVEFFDSAGMGTLLSIQKILKERGGRMAIAGANRSVLEVFRMVGFDLVFLLQPDEASAIRSLKP